LARWSPAVAIFENDLNRAQVARATGVSISMVSGVLAGQVSSASGVAAADRLLAKAALRL